MAIFGPQATMTPTQGRRPRVGWVLYLATVTVLACPGRPPDDGTGTTRIEVGTGALRFEPIAQTTVDGGTQELMIVPGPQGGTHLWGAVRANNLKPDGLTLVFTVRDVEAESTLSSQTLTLDLLEGEEGSEWAGMTGIVNDPRGTSGRLVELRMEATDVDGITASDSRRVIAVYQE